MDHKRLILCIGQGSLLGLSILLYVTFLLCFYQGNTLLIRSNDFNESLIEFFFIPLILIFGMYSTHQLLKKNKEEKDGYRERT